MTEGRAVETGSVMLSRGWGTGGVVPRHRCGDVQHGILLIQLPSCDLQAVPTRVSIAVVVTVVGVAVGMDGSIRVITVVVVGSTTSSWIDILMH